MINKYQLFDFELDEWKEIEPSPTDGMPHEGEQVN